MAEANSQSDMLVVLTALEVEYEAVRAHLAALRTHSHSAGTLFEIGWLDGTPWQVALAEIGDGNQAAAVLTERAVRLFRPRAVVFVGVAGALKDDIQLGDVVVATHVYAYHGGKEENGRFLARPRVWPIRHELEQLAKHVRRTGSWTRLLPPSPGDRHPAVHLKPIAAGEVVLNSAGSPLKRQLRQHYQDAVAIEMEGAGVAHAAHLNAALPALIVRGISDRADGRKYDADAEGWQRVAARNAAALAFSTLRELPVGSDRPAVEDPPARSSSVVFVSAPTSPSPEIERWRGGEEVEFPDGLYLLHDEYLEEHPSSDRSLIQRQALARRLDLTGQSASRYVWLRQIEARRDTPEARAAKRALADEHQLLARLRQRIGGLPGTSSLTSHGRTDVLAVGWPVSRTTGAPCQTLHAALGREGEPVDPWRQHRLLHGLAGLCGTLAALHDHGVTHRCLGLSAVIAHDDGRLVLRDLGLATRPPRPGEGPAEHQAPEQRRRASRERPGAWTDVHQLGAVAYRLITGHLPLPGTPLPLRAHVPDVPEPVDRAVRAALAQDPSERPAPRAFGAALRSACDELPRGV
ncbi:hypothetical protein ABZ208_24460 [Streptomyces sp. NPDC006208]|uniref:phosphorylase family protein n=1 Tax=Streptomyces sp. NPDC006208 TaxID=3156734 RepID=UPI0033B96F86